MGLLRELIQDLNEAASADYYIMNAKAGTGKPKSSIKDIIDFVGSDATIIVANRTYGYNKTTPMFLSGAGDSGYGLKVNDTESYVIDTGMNTKRGHDYNFEVQNVILVDKDGKIKSKLNNTGMNEKRAYWVMK